MQLDNFSQQEQVENLSYGAVLREVGNSTKDLIHSEIRLLTSELKQSARDFGQHAVQAAAFGALLALSVLPFMAFLVIGLGRLLDDNYWLSSLIVAVVFAAVGGFMAYRAYKKIKDYDLNFSKIKSTIQQSTTTVQGKVEEVKDAARGERHGTNQFH